MITRNDVKGQLSLIWDWLHSYYEVVQEEGLLNQEQLGMKWDEVCTAMAWIEEELGSDG